jgi:prophage regulatory protein
MTTKPTSYRPAQAAELLGISRATLWRWVAERHDFPRPRNLSRRCTVFDGAELLAWRDAQAQKAA